MPPPVRAHGFIPDNLASTANLQVNLEVRIQRFIGVEEARGELGRLVEEIDRTKEPVGLTKRGKAVAVIVSRDEYAQLKEIANERARQNLQKALKAARRQTKEAGLDTSVVDEAIAAARRIE